MADRPVASPFVSTGHLPPARQLKKWVVEAHELYRSNAEGHVSQVYPALARVPGDLFGVCLMGTTGNVIAVGDAEYEFAIMSVCKPFIFALVCEELGQEQVCEKIGVNATGLAFITRRGRAFRRPD